MRRRRVLRAAAVAALALLAPVAAFAQVTAAVGVSATISTTALSIAQQSDLDFGAAVPGVPVTVNARTGATAGMYEIHGARNAEIAITMALPTQLSTGFWTMPVTFGNTSGCWRRQGGQNGCNFWNPSTVLVERIRNNNPPNNQFLVWIGGTVTPSAAQHTGVYLANITMSVVYTGN
jgi:hypothetical protein